MIESVAVYYLTAFTGPRCSPEPQQCIEVFVADNNNDNSFRRSRTHVMTSTLSLLSQSLLGKFRLQLTLVIMSPCRQTSRWWDQRTSVCELYQHDITNLDTDSSGCSSAAPRLVLSLPQVRVEWCHCAVLERERVPSRMFESWSTTQWTLSIRSSHRDWRPTIDDMVRSARLTTLAFDLGQFSPLWTNFQPT